MFVHHFSGQKFSFKIFFLFVANKFVQFILLQKEMHKFGSKMHFKYCFATNFILPANEIKKALAIAKALVNKTANNLHNPCCLWLQTGKVCNVYQFIGINTVACSNAYQYGHRSVTAAGRLAVLVFTRCKNLFA